MSGAGPEEGRWRVSLRHDGLRTKTGAGRKKVLKALDAKSTFKEWNEKTMGFSNWKAVFLGGDAS